MKIKNKHLGFSLLEVLMGLLLFSMTILFLVSSFVFSTKHLVSGNKTTISDYDSIENLESKMQFVKEQVSKPIKPESIPGYSSQTVDLFTEVGSVFQREIKAYEVVAKEEGTDLNNGFKTYISDYNHKTLPVPKMKSVTNTNLVGGKNFPYAYIDESFTITTTDELDPESRDNYGGVRYLWYGSKQGYNIFLNKDLSTLTEKDLSGIPSFYNDYNPLNVKTPDFSSSNLKDFKGGYVSLSSMPLSLDGKYGYFATLNNPFFVIGLPTSDGLIAHFDSSIILNSDDLVEVETDVVELKAWQGLARNKTILTENKSSVNTFPNASVTSTGKDYVGRDILSRTLTFKNSDILKIKEKYSGSSSTGDINYGEIDDVTVFVVAKPLKDNSDSTILASMANPSYPGFELTFKGLEINNYVGSSTNTVKTIPFERNIEKDQWSVIGFNNKESKFIINDDDVKKPGDFVFGYYSTDFYIGGTPENLSSSLEKNMEIAEIIIYDKTLSDTQMEKIRDYLVAKYGFSY